MIRVETPTPTGPFCDDRDLAGVAVREAALLSVGGGLASFALMDQLRVRGVPAAELAVVGPDPDPAHAFRHLARCSQIGERDRLRSDSAARIDNVWGFPGYALEEALARRRLRPLLTVLGEPVASEVFTPVSGHVYHGIAREAARIGWAQMHVRASAERLRWHRDGGVVAFLRDHAGEPQAVRGSAVHLGLGYPSLGVSDHLRRFRAQFGDAPSVVHAYEPHEHLYGTSLPVGATVLVCGAGVTASRVIQRLLEPRHPSRPRVLHLARRAARASELGEPSLWNWQHFTVPKGAFGGQLARRVAGARTEGSRHRRIRALTAATAPPRADVRSALADGAAEGRYRALVGEVGALEPTADGRIRARISAAGRDPGPRDLRVHAVVDCTGLGGSTEDHPLLADLVAVGLARQNGFGRLAVGPAFEVPEARHGDVRVFASGAMTLGADLGPVDSFWGLQAAALRIAEELATAGMCPRFGTRASVASWWRWMRGVAP